MFFKDHFLSLHSESRSDSAWSFLRGAFADVLGGEKELANRAIWASAAIIIIAIFAVASAYVYYTYMMTGSGPSPSASPGSTSAASPTVTTDLNWGGYAAATDFNNPQPVISGVSGSWTVPEVAVSQNDTFSAIWVGIGGTFGMTLIQTGTEQDCVNGVVSYYAWYELLPDISVTIPTVNVSPGDTISASITLSDSTVNLWTISLSDLANGQSFRQDFFYNSSRLSAEWVVERPYVNNVLTQLADFSLITFSNCRLTIDNTPENLDATPLLKIVLANRQKIQLVGVSNLDGDGSSFTIKYMRPQ